MTCRKLRKTARLLIALLCQGFVSNLLESTGIPSGRVPIVFMKNALKFLNESLFLQSYWKILKHFISTSSEWVLGLTV